MNRQGKENEIPIVSLDFKKKQRPKPNTDRTNLSGSGIKQNNVIEAISLLEKKKQYSQAIREKNLSERRSSRDQSANEHNAKSSGNILRLSKTGNMNQGISLKVQKEAKMISLKEYKQKEVTVTSLPITQSVRAKDEKKETKPKIRDAKCDKSKIQKMMSHEPLQTSFQNNLSLISISNFTSPNERMGIDLSMIGKMHDISRIDSRGQLQVCSKEVEESFKPSGQIEKQMELLRKHNTTFKKELANFRKENGSVKREMEELKKQLAVIQERNDFLEDQNTDQLKLLEMLESKHSTQLPKEPSRAMSSPTNDGKLKQIISNYENDLFEATSLNKRLQFKNYMLKKRLGDEEAMNRKQVVKEIAVWKERYIKARNENMRMKDSRSQMMLDMSISRDEME